MMVPEEKFNFHINFFYSQTQKLFESIAYVYFVLYFIKFCSLTMSFLEFEFFCGHVCALYHYHVSNPC